MTLLLRLRRAQRDDGTPFDGRDTIGIGIEYMERIYIFSIDILAQCVSIYFILFCLTRLNIFSLSVELGLLQAQLWPALKYRRFYLFSDRLKRMAYITVGLAAVHTAKFLFVGAVSLLLLLLFLLGASVLVSAHMRGVARLP